MPHWVLRPDADDVARVYPGAALRRGVSGQAVMLCKVTADGSMSDCKLLSEQPAGMGFGEAALNLAPDFKMSTTKSDGSSIAGATVRIPMRFTAP
jgi:protein TonB